MTSRVPAVAALAALLIGLAWIACEVRLQAPTGEPPAMPQGLTVTLVDTTDSTATYRASWDCVDGADEYVVTAGSNDGRWSWTDTLSATGCTDGTATQTLVMRTRGL